MPELPDVENYRRYFESSSFNQRIRDVDVGRVRLLHGDSPDRLRKMLTGCRFDRTVRHGKLLLAHLFGNSGEFWLALHFGMTGRLAYFKHLRDDPTHDSMRLDFENGYHLAYVSERLLGRIELVLDPEVYVTETGLGPDALAVADSSEQVAEVIGRSRAQIKSALMDQSLIAGLGNVYSDEILYQAKLHPRKSARQLDRNDLARLGRAMRRVLRTAIDRGAGSEGLPERLPRTFLLRRREDGAPCPRCDGRIRTIKAAGRTAYFCPACQRE